MNNINDNLLKINSLEQYILNNQDLNKDRLSKFDELTKHYDKKIAEIYSSKLVQYSNDLKKAFIPFDLFYEVECFVKSKYDGKWEEYFSTVDLYYSTFNLENLTKCNIMHSNIYMTERDPKIKRQFRKLRKEHIWHASVLLKLVGKGASKYCCTSIFNEFKQNKIKEQEFIRNSVIVGEDKKVIPLSEACKTAEQNIAEKINIINTMEKIAMDREYTWCFITLTPAPEFHPNPTVGKFSYNGVSPRESALMMNKGIRRVRSLLAKNGVKAGRDYLGCASAETFKDGCMHKHMIFFCDSSTIEKIRKDFLVHFPNLNDDSFVVESEENKLKEYKKPNEEYVKGKFRVRATTYLFKYLMKSISNFDNKLDFNFISKDEDEVLYNSLLNQSFRTYNSIRGFSFFGIENCLSKFRYLARNMKKIENEIPTLLAQFIKDNNLYELIKGNHFDGVENIYVESNGNMKFVGCKINTKTFLKNFFKMCNKDVARNSLDDCAELARRTQEDIYSKLGLFHYTDKQYLKYQSFSILSVILNPNDSREGINTLKNKSENKRLEKYWLKIAESKIPLPIF